MSREIGRWVKELDTPALLVDLGKLERNVETMRRIIVAEAGIRWRPHTKGIKMPALAQKLVDAGASGVTCAKLGEAEVMAAAGITGHPDREPGRRRREDGAPGGAPAASRSHRGGGLERARRGAGRRGRPRGRLRSAWSSR